MCGSDDGQLPVLCQLAIDPRRALVIRGSALKHSFRMLSQLYTGARAQYPYATRTCIRMYIFRCTRIRIRMHVYMYMHMVQLQFQSRAQYLCLKLHASQ